MGVAPLADRERAGPFGDLVDERVGGVTDGHDDRQRHAALARRTEGARDDVLGREVEVRVRHDDGVVVGAAEGLDALAVGGADARDDLRHRCRSHETDGIDAGVFEDGLDHRLVTAHDLEQAVGQAGLLVELRDDQ